MYVTHVERATSWKLGVKAMKWEFSDRVWGFSNLTRVNCKQFTESHRFN